jgi:hypothetical protein
MTIVEHKWSALPVRYALDVVDRVPRNAAPTRTSTQWRPGSSGRGSLRKVNIDPLEMPVVDLAF